jgi:pyruvate dehydrogenase E2 component (dihydrolipoamide acetyltransferase)
MGAMREVQVPDIGDFKSVPVIEVLVSLGDTVAKDAPLIVLETDKATMEVPSPLAGVVRRLWIEVGDRLNQGMQLLTLEDETQPEAAIPSAQTAAASIESPAKKNAAPAATSEMRSEAAAKPAADLPASAPEAQQTVRASPALRKLARKLGVELIRVKPSGPGARLTREDLEAFVRDELARPAAPTANQNLLPWPQVDFAKFGAVERRPLLRLRKISGANLARNWAMIPHVTNFDEADITELEAFRVQLNREQNADAAKLTMLAFLIKGCVDALRRFPEFNASLDGEELVLKRYFHIGFAADTPNGLVAPVIRDADRKGLLEIAKETSELAALARAGKLRPEQMQGGCFSISSLGGIGGTGFTPIINAPEVAILGVTRAELKPKWDGTQFRPRLMLPLNLSWDHRVVDGAAAARFLVRLSALLADFRRIAL